MADHIANRDAVLHALRQELVGPCPLGEEIDCTQAIQLDDAEAAYRPYRQRGSGEEILQRDSPTKRYGVGVLYPMEAPEVPEESGAQPPPAEEEDGPAPGRRARAVRGVCSPGLRGHRRPIGIPPARGGLRRFRPIVC